MKELGCASRDLRMFVFVQDKLRHPNSVLLSCPVMNEQYITMAGKFTFSIMKNTTMYKVNHDSETTLTTG